MHASVHFTTATVKDFAARARAAAQAGHAGLARRLHALELIGLGHDVAEVTALLDVGRSTVYGWIVAFLLEGVDSLLYRVAPGRKAKLTGPEKAQLYALIVAGPNAAGYSTGCWNTALIADLLLRTFGVRYNLHYLSALLASIGLSYQKARFIAAKADAALQQRWLEQTWPAIVAKAVSTNALLLFGDEASFAQWGSLGYTWAPRGQQPEVRTGGRRRGYKVWGLVDWFSAQLFYYGQEGRLNATGYIEFLKQILAQTTQPLIIVQDGAPYHTAKQTREWVAQNAARVQVVQLPSYSPEYNPIEHVWRYVKEGTHNTYFATFAELQQRVEQRLQELQRDGGRTLRLLGTPLDALVTRPRSAVAA